MASDTRPITSTRQKVVLDQGFGLSDWMRMQGAMIPIGGKKKITLSELASHASESDCWTALNGKVYNITYYLKYHPGGIPKLMLAAGKDGTDLFNKYHNWVNIDSILSKCVVGTLVSDAEAAAMNEAASASGSHSSAADSTVFTAMSAAIAEVEAGDIPVGGHAKPLTKRGSEPENILSANSISTSIIHAIQPLNPNAVVFTGELSKQGHIIRNWKSRKFELRAFELRYMDNYNSVKGIFYITGASLEVNPLPSLDFTLRSPGGKSLTMRADNAANKELWIQHLNTQLSAIDSASHPANWNDSDDDDDDAERASKAVPASPSTVGAASAAAGGRISVPPPSQSAVASAIVVGEDVLACGVLSKQGHVNTNWKNRYFELLPTEIRYFDKTETQKVLKGKFHLGTALLTQSADPTNTEFYLTDPMGHILNIRAETTSAKNNWVRAISTQIAALNRR